MPNGPRINAFEPDDPISAWVTAGMACCTYPNHFGHLNGYVRLPVWHPDMVMANLMRVFNGQGYDAIEVWAPGGWTYGPDFEGWIGFDTGHYNDIWNPQDRLRFCPETSRALVDLMILMEREWFPPRQPWQRVWCQEAVEDKVRCAAQQLAMHERAIRAWVAERT